MSWRRRVRALSRCLVGCLLATLLAGGCGFSAYTLPLPGGADTGNDPYEITVEFADVLDLVPKSAVKVDDVSVGEVEEVWLAEPGATSATAGDGVGALQGSVAKVRLRVRGSVDLPDNAVARIRQTSLLGEKFVSLGPPSTEKAEGRLGAGDTIPLSRSGRNTEVEEVLSALSLLLNGGGVAQLKTISHELNKALGGREESVRTVLRELRTFVGQLDRDKRQITSAIDRVNALAKNLRKQEKTIEKTLDDLPGALTVLADQRANLTRMLKALSELGDTGARVIRGTKADLLANLRSLDPLLTELAKAGSDLPNALQLLFTYPFADSATNAVKGDFTNLQLTLDLDLPELTGPDGPLPLPDLPLPTLPGPTGGPTGGPTDAPPPPTDGPSPDRTGPDAPEPRPTSEPGPQPSDDPDKPCIPLPPLIECPDGAAGRSQARGAAARSDFDPELATLLLQGVAR